VVEHGVRSIPAAGSSREATARTDDASSPHGRVIAAPMAMIILPGNGVSIVPRQRWRRDA
jgi:hypothetical protein